MRSASTDLLPYLVQIRHSSKEVFSLLLTCKGKQSVDITSGVIHVALADVVLNGPKTMNMMQAVARNDITVYVAVDSESAWTFKFKATGNRDREQKLAGPVDRLTAEQLNQGVEVV